MKKIIYIVSVLFAIQLVFLFMAFDKNEDKIVKDSEKAILNKIDIVNQKEAEAFMPYSEYNYNSSLEEELSEPDLGDDKQYKSVMTSVFWVGEKADASNGFIANDQSFWDPEWEENFGGLDSPDKRCGYNPCQFTPKENPFYFALPYADFENEVLKASVAKIPWYDGKNDFHILKNRWIEIKYQSTICYAQWEDVGPFETDDFDYVFGGAEPKNQFGVKAGLDVSPAVRDCLGLRTNDITSWRFVEAHEVMEGPWTKTITVK